MDNFNASSFKSLRIGETPFRNLMQKRIFNVQLIATPYDAFMMEEYGLYGIVSNPGTGKPGSNDFGV